VSEGVKELYKEVSKNGLAGRYIYKVKPFKKLYSKSINQDLDFIYRIYSKNKINKFRN
jgi:hypothetical protein